VGNAKNQRDFTQVGSSLTWKDETWLEKPASCKHFN